MRHGNLFVISGPSGAGKGTLVALLMRKVSDAWLSISLTTRPPRHLEVEGRDYYFVSKSRFRSLIATNGLLEWASYGNHLYGTPRSNVEKHIECGDQVILEIEVQGALQVREKFPQAHLIFIEPPNLDELAKRLHKRATESEDVVNTRLERAKVELSYKKEYDITLVNDDVEQAAQKLVWYVNKTAEQI